MASNSTQLSCANSSYKYTLSVSWDESSTDISTNTSTISAKGSLSASNVGFDAQYSSYACHLKLYWHDNANNTDTLITTSSAFTTCGLNYGTRYVSGIIKVTHKDDGTLSGYVKVYFDAPTTSGGWSPSSASCSTAWTRCTEIARASSIKSVTSASGYLGKPVTVTIDHKSSDFVHEVQYKFTKGSWTVVQSNVTTSCVFTPPESLANNIPNAEFGTLQVCVGTFKNGQQIGDWKYSNIALYAPADAKPSIGSFTLSPVNTDITGTIASKAIQNISKVKAVVGSATSKYGATIKSYSITGPSLNVKSSSGTSGVVSKSGSITYTCTVTDSRGRSVSLSKSITFYEYFYPFIKIKKASRCKSDKTDDPSGTILNVILEYTYASVDNLNEIATMNCNCNGVSSTSFASGKSFILNANLSAGSQYSLTATVTDILGNSATATTTIPTAFRILNVNKAKKGIAIGKFSEKDAFEVNLNSYIYGKLVATKGISQEAGRLTSLNKFYGDTAIRYYLATDKTTEGKPPKDSGVLDLAWDNNKWDIQMAVEKEHIYTRAGSNGKGDWSPWKTYLPVDALFPVGAVYLTYNNNNPGNFLGGTWVQFGQGRTLMGQGTGSDGTNSMTFAANSTGGKYKMTHSHNTSFGWDDGNFYAASPSGKGNKDYSRTSTVANGYSLPNLSSKPVTSSKVQLTEDATKEIIQPYITIYFWRRTA